MSGISLCHRMLKIFKKESVSQSTRIALKRIEMQKEFIPLMSGISLCRRMLKFKTITWIKVPKFSPSLIKVQPIVTEI